MLLYITKICSVLGLGEMGGHPGRRKGGPSNLFYIPDLLLLFLYKTMYMYILGIFFFCYKNIHSQNVYDIFPKKLPYFRQIYTYSRHNTPATVLKIHLFEICFLHTLCQNITEILSPIFQLLKLNILKFKVTAKLIFKIIYSCFHIFQLMTLVTTSKGLEGSTKLKLCLDRGFPFRRRCSRRRILMINKSFRYRGQLRRKYCVFSYDIIICILI